MNSLGDEERKYYALVQQAFETLAPFYDIVTLPLARLRRLVATLAGARPGTNVLDIATGTGSQAIAFARRGHVVTAIDVSPAMLRIAREKKGADLVHFEAGDATRLRFASNTFDVVSVSFALHDMPEGIRQAALKEMVRVARPGGMILIVDYGLPANRMGRLLVHRLVSLYEGPYYEEFVQTDLPKVLARTGAAVVAMKAAWLGAVRIWRGRKA